MGFYEVKQLIIVRKDLGMKKGKMAAQACHASMGALLSMATKMEQELVINFDIYPVARKWLYEDFAKVVLRVNSEEELRECYKIAQDNDLPCAFIIDNGITVFNNVKTPTCIGIGPASSEQLDALFGHLKLF